MKNAYGVTPGIYYGCQKCLARKGIIQSILGLNATRKPRFSIVDEITGIEGDGPIMGTPMHAGDLVIDENFPAIDTTRSIMRIDSDYIPYLKRTDQ